MPQLTQVVPRLPAADLSRTVGFYKEALGFEPEVLWPEDAPTFVILRRDAARLGFFQLTPEHEGRIGYAELYVEVRDLPAVYAELRDRLEIEWGPEVYTYGRRELGFRDPDRYLVILTEPTDDPPTTDEP